jgi:regulatory protein
MIITAVERKRGPQGRVRIYIDGQPALDLPRETARKRDLHPGRVIAHDELAAITAAEAKRVAFDTAARMIARRPHSEREIRRRLAQRRVAPALADETIERLKQLRAIDDAGFAQSYAETRDRTSPRSARLVVAELRAHGVDAATASDAGEAIDDAEAASRFAQRRARSLSSLEYDAFRARLSGQLQRRGFSWNIIRRTIEDCWRDVHGTPASAEPARFIE